MQTINMKHLEAYHETEHILNQAKCEHELHLVLDGLLGLVAVSKMPAKTRSDFVTGIAHLRTHIESETQDMVSNMVGRQQ
jgi:hypothetical protein